VVVFFLAPRTLPAPHTHHRNDHMVRLQVSFAKTRGVSGFVVFKYGLRRRPGQEQGLSKHVGCWGCRRCFDAVLSVEGLAGGQEVLALV